MTEEKRKQAVETLRANSEKLELLMNLFNEEPVGLRRNDRYDDVVMQCVVQVRMLNKIVRCLCE